MSDVLVLNADGNPLSLLPVSVIKWQTAIKLITLEKIEVIVEYEDWIVHSPSVSMEVPSVAIMPEYVNWPRQVKYNRTNVYLRDMFTCQYCRSKFHPSFLTLDHVLPRSQGGVTSWKNITTSCKNCNHRKGDDRTIRPAIMPHKPSYYELVAKRKKYPLRIRDERWLDYLGWPKDLIQYELPINNGANNA